MHAQVQVQQLIQGPHGAAQTNGEVNTREILNFFKQVGMTVHCGTNDSAVTSSLLKPAVITKRNTGE